MLNLSIINDLKSSPFRNLHVAGVELFHADRERRTEGQKDRQTGRQDKTNRRISQLRECKWKLT